MRKLLAIMLMFVAHALCAAEPETIFGVAHVKKGAAEKFRALERDSWGIYTRLGLVRPDPHLLLEGVETDDKPFFVMVFTWKDAAIPDNAPQEVRDVWAKMQSVCESRDGHSSMEITEMHIVP